MAAPATSAASTAANRRSTRSPVKINPMFRGKLNACITELWADVRLGPCPKRIIRYSGAQQASPGHVRHGPESGSAFRALAALRPR